MSELTLSFNTPAELLQQLDCMVRLFAAPLAPASVTDSVALFSDDELQAEVKRRAATEHLTLVPPAQPVAQAAPAPAAAAPSVLDSAVDQPVKRKRGRPRKEATVASQPTATAAKGNGAANEPGVDPAAVPARLVEPDKASTSPAPDLPTEDEMLSLMSEVYSDSGDMELVRSVMSEIGGKTQLSLIDPGLWPALRTKLLSVQAGLKKQGAAA